MNEVVADTHSLIWFLFDPSRLSTPAAAALNAAATSTIHLSAISLVELAYLIDKGRLTDVALDLLIQAVDDPARGIVLAPVDPPVARAVRRVPRRLVPEMPARIIAATALHLGLPLVTADQQIRAAGTVTTIW
ncbi:MAG TPA: PIN domain-containing protein [Isosphaeraceae bacterium]|jgi:PIN domain nuclease of toxin-antitoxin system